MTTPPTPPRGTYANPRRSICSHQLTYGCPVCDAPDTPPHPEPVADGCNLCGCVWDEEGYCACDRAVLNDEPAWEDDDV